jgi:hypothetical protein
VSGQPRSRLLPGSWNKMFLFYKCNADTQEMDIRCLFFKNGGQEGKTGPVWGLVPSEGGGGYKERV